MKRTAILYIQDRCNQDCVFCLEEGSQTRIRSEPTTEGVEELIRDMRARGGDHITFMGAETFFRKDLCRIIAYAKEQGFTRVGVTTNGTILSTKGYLRRHVEAGLDFIEMSVHGHTPEVANRIGRTSFTFARQAAALAELDEIGLPVIFNVVVCAENKDHMVDVARYIAEGFPRIRARIKLKLVSLIGAEADRTSSGGEALSYADVDPIPVGDYLRERNIPYWFGNFPLCRLGHHAAHAQELGVFASQERFFDYKWEEGTYFDNGFQLSRHLRPDEPCLRCSVRPLCPGVERERYERWGAGELLRPLSDDPLPILAAALADRGDDPALATARLEQLRVQREHDEEEPPKEPHRPSGIRIEHSAEPAPIALRVDPAVDGAPAFASTPRFSLSYQALGDADPYQRPRVRGLLAAVVEALQAVDAAGGTLEAAKLEAVRVAEGQGWVPGDASGEPGR